MMKVGLVSPVSFKAEGVQAQQPVSQSVAATPQTNVNTTENTTIRNGKSKSFKEGIASVWKFFATANKMVQASIKGLVYGAITGAAFLGGSWLFKTLPKAFTKEGPKFSQIIRHPLNNIAKSGKVMAGIAGGAVFAYQIVAGKLAANQKTAVIDHKLKTGHTDIKS